MRAKTSDATFGFSQLQSTKLCFLFSSSSRHRPPVDIVHLVSSDPSSPASSLDDSGSGGSGMGGAQSTQRGGSSKRSGRRGGGHHNGGVDSVGPLRSMPGSGIGAGMVPGGANGAGGGPRRPMPDEAELERRFNLVLVQMDLPPERAKHLRSFDAAKKWDIICDQEQVHARDPPSAYLSKIRTYLDPSSSRSAKSSKKGAFGDSTSTQVLRNLEISLRTNNIEWVREFLNEENRGLDVLVNYLGGRLLVMRHTMKLEAASSGDADDTFTGDKKSIVGSIRSNTSLKKAAAAGGGAGVSGSSLELDGPRISKLMRHSTKLKMGDTTDDIHVCIMCLRAIMNNKFGFNMVIQHKQAINCIALSLVRVYILCELIFVISETLLCLFRFTENSGRKPWSWSCWPPSALPSREGTTLSSGLSTTSSGRWGRAAGSRPSWPSSQTRSPFR